MSTFVLFAFDPLCVYLDSRLSFRAVRKLRCKTIGFHRPTPVLLAQGITGLAALGHSQSYLSCKLTSWSCPLKELLVLQLAHRITYLATHRLGLACSRDYWSCSPRLLTELPVLQTHGVVLLLKGLLVLQLSARSQGYLSCKLTAWQLVRPNSKIHGNILIAAWLSYVSNIDIRLFDSCTLDVACPHCRFLELCLKNLLINENHDQRSYLKWS